MMKRVLAATMCCALASQAMAAGPVYPGQAVTSNDGGTAVNGATIPTGGVGVTGWLSAIWSTLTGAATASGQATANTSLGTIATNTAGAATATGQTSGNTSLASILTKLGTTLATADASNAAFQGVVAITPGTPVAAQRSLGFICTVAGNVTLTLADASTVTIAIAVSPQFQSLPFAVTNVALGTGTAGSFWNLK